MIQKNQDVLNRSQHMSQQMESYNEEQIRMLKEHNGFCYEDGNDYTVRWDADGAYLSGPGHEDTAKRLDLDNASHVLRQRFPESIKDGLIENLPAVIEGIMSATAAAEPATEGGQA